MKQSSKLVLGLSLAVILMGAQTVATAAVKAGQSCSKAGITSTYKGVKYTCIKSGKKYVWNKGVKIAPVAKPTPTPTPTPEVTPPPTATVTPTPTPTPAPSTSPIAPVVTVQGRAMGEIMKSLAPTKGLEFFKYHYSPRADKTIIDFIETDLRRSIDYWRSYLKPTGLFNVFYGTQDDLNWMIEAWKPYGHDPNGGFANDLRGRIAREGNNLNAGAVPSENGSSHLSILRHTSKSIQFGDYSFITHESIHVVQQSVSSSNTAKFPCWLREGSANLFGAYLAKEFHNADYERTKSDQMYMYRQGSSGVDVAAFTPSEWLKHLKDLEGSASGACDYVNKFAYGTGLLLSELLVADHGVTPMVDFWRSFKDNSLRDGFASSYNANLDTWYETKAVPYLMSEYARVKR